MRETLPDRVRLGVFEVDLRAGELRSGDRTIYLQEQPLSVLRMLVERGGDLVTREELKQKLWPNDTVVDFDQGINAAVRRLRLALADSADEPRYLATIARRGYRLLLPVEALEPARDVPQGEFAEPEAANRERSHPSDASSTNLIGKRVSHYRVLEVIGGGGMGLVYKAEDLKLGRCVALKFLPEELARDPIALQRFEREAKTASALDHPNICTVHAVEEYEEQPFIAMQLLQGETLRDRLAALAGEKKLLPLSELLAIALQGCQGLQAAHEKGIIHRDIKPANIFLTTSGQVKILDFGLAKAMEGEQQPSMNNRVITRDEPGAAIEEPRDPYSGIAVPRMADPPPGRSPQMTEEKLDATLTLAGQAMGTAGYMSPEQVRGEKLDIRTDLFSFGLVLYEMATGRRAFAGENAAVVHNAILNNAPTPVCELNSTLPAKLVITIDKALEKNRERRYQSAAEVRAGLQELQAAKPQRIVLPQWRWYGVAGLILVIAVAGLLYRRAHPPIRLTDKDTLVVADVMNRTGDPLLDDSLDNPLSQELREAPYINLLNSGKIRETLQGMNVPADAKFTPELAQAVCLRTNSRAYVAPSIADNGNRYQIRLQAIDCHSGRTLATAETEAGERDHIIHMLGVAGHNLRAALGEPGGSLARFATPLEDDWTSSLEASKALSLGVRAGQEKGGAAELPLLQRAVELDPKFVLALLNLAPNLGSDQRELSRKYMIMAFNLRDRVSLRTRLLTEGAYYGYVTGELEKAVHTHLQWLREYPADLYPHQNIYVSLQALGRQDEAIAQAQEAAHLLTNRYSYNILMSGFIYANRLHEAKAVFDEAEARHMDDLDLRAQRYQVALFESDAAAMQHLIGLAPDSPQGRDWVSQQQGDTAIYQGRLSAARAYYSAIAGYSPNSAENVAQFALWDVETGDTARAKQKAQKALAENPGIAAKGVLGLVFARAGDGDQAEQMANDVSRELPVDTLVQNYLLPTIRAAMQLSAGRAQEAIETLKVSAPYELAAPDKVGDLFGGLYPCYVRGLAYLQLGDGKQAAAEFQKLVDHPGLGFPSPTTALSRLQLARAQAMMGDKASALKSYQDFLTLWKNADPEIPIYNQAKAEYAKL